MSEYATSFGNSAANALPAQRAQFIRKTYMLLAAAILAFVVIESLLFVSGAAYAILGVLTLGGSMGWLVVLAAFMGISYLANRWAMSDTSPAMQHLGLGILV